MKPSKAQVRGVIMENLANAGHAAGPGTKNAVSLNSRVSDTDHNHTASAPKSIPLIMTSQYDMDHNRAASSPNNPVPLNSSPGDTDHTVGQGPKLRSLSNAKDQDHSVGQGPRLSSLPIARK